MHTSHLPKVPVLMNELPCVEPFMLSLPASRRSSHTRAIRRAACACEHCVSVASLSLLFRACKRVHVLSWGVKRLPNVVNSFPIPPFPSPYPPIHPIPTRFPLVGCLWRRDVSSLPLYIAPKNEEREREMFVFFFLLLFFFFFFLFLFLVAALLLLLDLIRRLISGGSTRHLFFKTKSRTSLRFLF